MKSNKNIEPLKLPIMQILESAHYPKSVKNIESTLINEGLIGGDERGEYRVVIGKWLHRQENIIAHTQANTTKRKVYMLNNNAKRFNPQFLEGGEEE